MYRVITSSGVIGLLDISKASEYGDMFLGVGILVIFLVEYMFMWIMARMPPLGGSNVVNCGFLHRFLLFV